MPVYNMEMVLEWAKVFPENADMGNPDGPRAAQAIHQKGGQYIVNAYFTSEDQIQQLLDDGLDPNPMNSNRILEGTPELGIGKYMKLKRGVADDIREFEGKGGKQIVNFGGPVGVINIIDGIENKRVWSLEDDGLIGNGSKAIVQFQTYSRGAGVRLMNIAVTEQVVYEAEAAGGSGNSKYNGLFDMGEVA
jgi:hypothetical protein